MSTTTEPRTTGPATMLRSSIARPEVDARVLLHGVDWSLFESICASRGDRPVPRITYVDGDLELMSPSYWHECLKGYLTGFVQSLARGLQVNFRSAGSTTWQREDVIKAKEPDACFYLANEPRIRGLRDIDLTEHPPPDLAIEIVLTNPLLDALVVYGALGVPEVWTFDGQILRFLQRRQDGSYIESETSLAFPMLRAWEAVGWIMRAETLGEMQWTVEVERWAREELATRREGTA